jgi:predicted porin
MAKGDRQAAFAKHQRVISAKIALRAPSGIAGISEHYVTFRRGAVPHGFAARHLALCTVAAFATLVPGLGTTARAQSPSDAQIKALQAQIEQLQRSSQAQINALQRQVKQLSDGQAKSSADAKAARSQAAEAKAEAAKAELAQAQGAARGKVAQAIEEPIDTNGHRFLERKPGNPLTFYTPGGEITGYGNLDISFDDTSKDVKSLDLNGSTPPVGNFGWMPAISTNLSYLGVRGFQRLPDMPFNFVYQAEVGFDISATPGLKQTNSNISDTVNGALFNRNTYIGLSSPEWGAIKIGKTTGPYQNSTAAFNPFAGQIGDYSVIMGNTGGDNRVEFGTRLDHSIWYESPSLAGLQFNFLFSPGQNRDDTSADLGAGESDCAGGNGPTSGGNFPIACNDGAFSNVISTNLSYTNGPLYVTAAYERHYKVNRQSDISTGIFGLAAPADPALTGCSPAAGNCVTSAGVAFNLPSAYAAQLFNQDVADEDAFKVGALYRLPTRTTVGAIFESFHRYVPADLEFQNERQRNGTWLFVSQDITDADSIHFGWAHAFHTPGDPGQHNDQTLITPQGAPFAPNDNQADMVTASLKHRLSENLTWYTAVAATFNGPSAHYDLGAGGRGVTTDCHDAFGADGSFTSAPHCYTGTTIAGASTGLQWRF